MADCFSHAESDVEPKRQYRKMFHTESVEKLFAVTCGLVIPSAFAFGWGVDDYVGLHLDCLALKVVCAWSSHISEGAKWVPPLRVRWLQTSLPVSNSNVNTDCPKAVHVGKHLSLV